MKKAIFLISCLVLICALSLIVGVYLVENGYTREHRSYIPLGDIVIRHDQPKVNYYTEAGVGPIGSWKAGTSKIYAFQGSQKVYTYFLEGTERFQVRVPVEKGWQYEKYYYSLLQISTFAYAGIAIGVLFFVMSAVPVRGRGVDQPKQSRPVPETRMSSQPTSMATRKRRSGFWSFMAKPVYASTANAVPDDELSRLEMVSDTEKGGNYAIEEENRKLKKERNRVAEDFEKIKAEKINLEKTNHRLTRQNIELIKNKTEDVQQLKLAFEQQERKLRDQFEQEANEIERRFQQEHHVEIGRMQEAYERLKNQFELLNQQYQQIKSEGLVFDIDYDSKKYENLLKGRLYEIHFAKSLLEDLKFEVLSWTSDKGFENGIVVKSNGDPDFIIQYNQELTFAVECKYRSNFYARKKPLRIEWGDTWQAERYLEFQRTRQVPVFVAVGIEGPPDQPVHEYLVALDFLYEKSEGCHWNNDRSNSEQQVVDQATIFDYYFRKKDNFPERTLELVTKQLATS
ncbi:hypothetical protein [Reinekea sp. G2M2-21]|uniref:hypothetical protein n=1 Tax=Reinekea sp. G2M2-21 TaxID=2788942 RepID=UPI0018AAD90C|nr:hypothetical protein [Reinekea sp. G2M2-21]